MIKDYFTLAVTTIVNRRLRSWLTMIGIFIGIAAVVALISLGQGLQKAVSEQFALIGADKLFVTPKGNNFGPPGFTAAGKLEKKDVGLISDVRGVDSAAGRLLNTLRVEFGDRVSTPFVASVPDNEDGLRLLQEIELIKVQDGRFLRVDDKNKIVVGSQYTDKNFLGREVRIGSKIVVQGVDFKVVGVLQKSGDPGIDGGILMAEEDLRQLVGNKEGFNGVMVKTRAGADPLDVAEGIARMLRRDRGLKEGKEDFEIQTPEQILERFGTVLTIVQVVLVGIAAISLLVGGIGIMNTMYTSVVERTREIGIMKAVGARNGDILTVFLVESGLLGLSGGVIGVLIGIGLSKAVEYAAQQAFGTTLIQAQVSWWLVIGALLFSFVIGTASGVFPARRAAALTPVEALRYE